MLCRGGGLGLGLYFRPPTTRVAGGPQSHWGCRRVGLPFCCGRTVLALCAISRILLLRNSGEMVYGWRVSSKSGRWPYFGSRNYWRVRWNAVNGFSLEGARYQGSYRRWDVCTAFFPSGFSFHMACSCNVFLVLLILNRKVDTIFFAGMTGYGLSGMWWMPGVF